VKTIFSLHFSVFIEFPLLQFVKQNAAVFVSAWKLIYWQTDNLLKTGN